MREKDRGREEQQGEGERKGEIGGGKKRGRKEGMEKNKRIYGGLWLSVEETTAPLIQQANNMLHKGMTEIKYMPQN